MELIQEEVLRQWYLVLSRFSATLTVPVSDLADRVELPLLTVLLFGLVGAVAPCQLTTNLSAMAYVSGRLGEGRPWREALAYILGKAMVYTLVGAGVVVLGLQLQAAAIPVVVVARRALGPLMIVPLAVRSAGGWAFPGLFALGTALPLLAFTALLAAGTGAAGGFVERVKRSHRLVIRVAGVIFILAGINDTLTYWAL